MVQKILAVVDPTGRDDGDLLSWDAGAGAHVYVAPAGAASAAVVANEIRNFPSMEGADDAQPEWWEEEAASTAVLTEVDVAGEGITETWERALKVVTTADDYAYQLFTYADEPRLKSGRTVSCRVAVWAVAGVTARVRLQSSVGSLAVGTSTAAAWTIITLDAVVLDGTTVDLRFEVNNGTAYFRPLAFGIGASAPHELPPRGLRFRWRDGLTVVDLSGQADPATWTDVDATSATSPLAAVAKCFGRMFEAASSFTLYVRRNGSSQSDYQLEIGVVTVDSRELRTQFDILLDDQQVFEYMLDRFAGSTTLDGGQIGVVGWWEWA